MGIDFSPYFNKPVYTTIENDCGDVMIIDAAQEAKRIAQNLEKIINIAKDIKDAFSQKCNPTKDEFVKSNNQNSNANIVSKPIAGITAPGIHQNEKGTIDGVKPGITANGELVTVSEDGHFSVTSQDGKITDGRFAPRQKPAMIYNTKNAPIAGITAPGIHQNEKGIIDGVKPGITANGELVTVSEDGHFSVTSQDGKITDGRFAPRQKPAMIY